MIALGATLHDLLRYPLVYTTIFFALSSPSLVPLRQPRVLLISVPVLLI